MKQKISAVVHTKNAAKTLEQTLFSLDFVDEIVVIDMQSSDGTLAIAKRFTEKVHSVEDVGFADPLRNFGVEQAEGPWIFSIDADEVVPDTLKDKLLKIVNEDIDVWEIPRKNMIFGRWMKYSGWWPDYQIKFFKKGSVIWSNKAHTKPQVKGKGKQLPAEERLALVHHNYLNLSDYIDRLNRYTSIQANDREPVADTDVPEAAIKAFWSDFLRKYYQFEGYKDGDVGLYTAFLQGMYEMTVVLKQWEKQGFPEAPVQFEKMLNRLQTELAYWIADRKVKEAGNPLSRMYWQVRRKLKI